MLLYWFVFGPQPSTDSVTVEQVSIKASPPQPATAVLPAAAPLGSVLVKVSVGTGRWKAVCKSLLKMCR